MNQNKKSIAFQSLYVLFLLLDYISLYFLSDMDVRGMSNNRLLYEVDGCLSNHASTYKSDTNIQM